MQRVKQCNGASRRTPAWTGSRRCAKLAFFEDLSTWIDVSHPTTALAASTLQFSAVKPKFSAPTAAPLPFPFLCQFCTVSVAESHSISTQTPLGRLDGAQLDHLLPPAPPAGRCPPSRCSAFLQHPGRLLTWLSCASSRNVRLQHHSETCLNTG